MWNHASSSRVARRGARSDARSLLRQLLARNEAEHDAVGAADVLFRLGDLAWQEGDLPGALGHFRAALERDPEHGPTRQRVYRARQVVRP